MPSREALAVGFGLNARGAMEIILASVALESGLIDPGVSRKSFPLEESGDVFRQLLQGSSDGFLKAIVCPG